MRIRQATGGALALLMALALVVVMATTGPHPGAMLSALQGLAAAPASRALAGLILFLLLLLGAVTPFPIKLVALTGAVIFDPGQALLLNWLGSLCGAVLAYEIGCLGGVDLCASPRTRQLCKWLRRHGDKTLLGLRLLPAVPFFALNLAAGMLGLDRARYVLVTALGIIPAVTVLTLFPRLFLT